MYINTRPFIRFVGRFLSIFGHWKYAMCWINLSTHRIHKWMQKIQTSFPRQLWRNIFLNLGISLIKVVVCIGTLKRYLKYILECVDKTHFKKIQRHDQCSSLWVMAHLIWPFFLTKNAPLWHLSTVFFASTLFQNMHNNQIKEAGWSTYKLPIYKDTI